MASNRGVTIAWLGHSATKIQTGGGKTILIDPWLRSNPSTPDDQKQIDRLDLMLITHGHFDHMSDAVSIAEATEPDVITNFEIAHFLEKKGIKKTNGINKGGTVEWNGLSITMVNAIHSSGITDGENIVYGGEAAGFVIRFEDGFTLYHSGDTELFGDMKLIGERHHPDVAMLPIGGHFTMDPKAAADALRLLGVATVIPIHYGTFPLLKGTPEELRDAGRGIAGLRVVALKPGESVSQSDLT